MTDRFYNLNDIFKSLNQTVLTISSDVETISQSMGITSSVDLTLHNDLVDLNTKIALLDINNQNTGLTLHKDLTGLNSSVTLMDINNQSIGLTLHKDLTTLNTTITLMDINSQNTGLTLHKDLTGLNSNVSLLNNTVYLMDINSQNTGLTLHKDLTTLNTTINTTITLMDINNQNTGLTLHKDLTTLNTTITLLDINNQSTGLTLHKDLTTLNTTITLMDINNQNTGLTLHKDLTTINTTITLMDINNQSMGLTLHTDLTTLNSTITLMDINNQSTGLTLHKALTGLNTSITLMDINNQSMGLTLHKALTGIDSKLVQQFNTTNEYGKTGLNIYQIYPRKLQYFLYGINSNGVSNMLLGGVGCTASVSTFTFGKANPQAFSAIMTSGVVSVAVPKTIKYHYTDTNGNLQTDGSVSITGLNIHTLIGNNRMSINKAWIVSPAATDVLHVRVGNTSVATATTTVCTSKIDEQYNGIITVPTGYIGYLSAANVYSPTPSWMGTLKWEEDGSRNVSWLAYNTGNQVHTGGYGGSIGGIYYPGETIGLARFTSMVGGAMGGMFVLEPI